MVLFVLLGSSFVSVGVSSVIWTQSYGGADEQDVASLVETSDGGFALAGNTLSIVGNLEDYFLVKTDSSGNMLWNKTYGGSDRDYAYSVVEASDGGFALVGYSSFSNSVFWLVKTDSSGNMEWNKNYGESLGWDGYPVIATSDGGFAFASSSYYEAAGVDCWLIKADAAGNVVWNQTYTEEDNQSVDSFIETSDGGFALVGSNAGISPDGDFWLIRTDEHGIPEFPSWAIMPLLLTATVLAIIFKKRLHATRNSS